MTKEKTIKKSIFSSLFNKFTSKTKIIDSNKKLDKTDLECPICLEEQKTMIKLICGHEYCNNCINLMFKSAENSNKIILCPLCRKSCLNPLKQQLTGQAAINSDKKNLYILYLKNFPIEKSTIKKSLPNPYKYIITFEDCMKKKYRYDNIDDSYLPKLSRKDEFSCLKELSYINGNFD